MKNWVLLLGFIAISTSYASRKSEFQFHYIDIFPVGPGSELSLNHIEPVSEKVSVLGSIHRVDKFGIREMQFQLGTENKWPNAFTSILLCGYSPDGVLLSKYFVSLEGIKSVGSGVSAVGVAKYQKFSDSQLKMLVVGLDYEPTIPLITTVRLFLTQTDFDSVEDDFVGGAGLLKFSFLLPYEHKLSIWGSYGVEGIYRGQPSVATSLLSWVAGVGADFRLGNHFRLKPTIEVQRYPEVGTRFIKLGSLLEVNW